MYLTAQRVLSPQGDGGINAFQYLHGNVAWDGLPPPGIPDQRPGTLTAQTVVVRPPGNRVRSYLDVVTPDDAPWSEIRQAFMTFVSEAQPTPFPWTGVVGRCLFRLGMEQSLASSWHREIADLYRAVQTVRIGG